MNRREWLQNAATFAISAGLGGRMLARGSSAASVASRMPVDSKGFPPKFLWGAATAAHQVEGNNLNSDNWLLQRAPNTMYKEPSGVPAITITSTSRTSINWRTLDSTLIGSRSDRETQKRTVKPNAVMPGKIAKANSL